MDNNENEVVKVDGEALSEVLNVLFDIADTANDFLLEDLVEEGATITETALCKDFIDRYLNILAEGIVSSFGLTVEEKIDTSNFAA